MSIEAMKQALEALDGLYEPGELDRVNKAITALRTAIEQAEKQEPVALPCCGYTDASAIKWNPFNGVVQCHNCGQTYAPPAAPYRAVKTVHEGKPVYVSEPAAPVQDECVVCGDKVRVIPRPWVGLTDREVGAAYDFAEANSQYGHHHFGFWMDFYRAIETKLREKNGGQA